VPSYRGQNGAFVAFPHERGCEGRPWCPSRPRPAQPTPKAFDRPRGFLHPLATLLAGRLGGITREAISGDCGRPPNRWTSSGGPVGSGPASLTDSALLTLGCGQLPSTTPSSFGTGGGGVPGSEKPRRGRGGLGNFAAPRQLLVCHRARGSSSSRLDAAAGQSGRWLRHAGGRSLGATTAGDGG